MTTEMATLPLQCTIGWALKECARLKFQAFPVIDQERRLQGILSIMMVFQSILPPYILSGELAQVSFDPDLEEVHQKLDALRNQPIERIMKTNPPTVSSESVLPGLRHHSPTDSGTRPHLARGRIRSPGGSYCTLGSD